MFNFSDHEWGLVLSGGGGKGAYQAGVFKALEQYGIVDSITAVSGASVGALNMALFDNANSELAYKIWGEISPQQFLKLDDNFEDFTEGILSRDGLINIIDTYINLDDLRNSQRRLYVSVTEYDNLSDSTGQVKYLSLNYNNNKDIKDILLASSALPIIYPPVEMNGKFYRDGGIKDNLPIAPLYMEGIRNFIVVGMSPNTVIDYSKYPDAKFLFIKPHKSIGEFWDGTLDFTSLGAKIRMELGYLDAVRDIEYFEKEDEISKQEYNNSVNNDYLNMKYKSKQMLIKNTINNEMDKINKIINKYL
jgi:NTE family protein